MHSLNLPNQVATTLLSLLIHIPLALSRFTSKSAVPVPMPLVVATPPLLAVHTMLPEVVVECQVALEVEEGVFSKKRVEAIFSNEVARAALPPRRAGASLSLPDLKFKR